MVVNWDCRINCEKENSYIVIVRDLKIWKCSQLINKELIMTVLIVNLHTNAKICICACVYVIPAIFGVLDYCNYYAKRKYLRAYIGKRARPCLFSLLLYIE